MFRTNRNPGRSSRKHVLISLSLLIPLSALVSCGKGDEFNPFFGELPPGTQKLFYVLNEEGRQEYYYTETLGEAHRTPEGTVFTITTQMFENNGRPSVNGHFLDTYLVAGDSVVNRIPRGSDGNGLRGEYASGDLPVWTNTFHVGKELPSYSASTIIRFEVFGRERGEQGLFTCTDRKITDRKTVKTQAGTYECFRLKEKYASHMGENAMSELPDTYLTTSIAKEVGVVAVHEVFHSGKPFTTKILGKVTLPGKD